MVLSFCETNVICTLQEASEKEQAESTVTPDVAINIEEDGDGQTPAQHALQVKSKSI